MKVRILRQEAPDTTGYWENFDVELTDEMTDEMTVAGLLDFMNFNDDIQDDTGRKTTRIGWECSCLQGMCGSCAMVINGVPALACDTMVKDLKGKEITIRPLQKFPVIHDLVVDRSDIYRNLHETNVYIGKYKPTEEKNPKRREEEHLHQYEAAKCLKCGLCLEVCPNYVNGKTFFGAVFANDCYLVAARNRDKEPEMVKYYKAHFGNTCSKALSCVDVCPMEIPTLASIAKMNRKW